MSDHKPILSIFSFLPHACQFESRPLWKKANKEAIIEKAIEINSFPCTFSSISDIDFSIDCLISRMKRVVDEHVPMSKPAKVRVPWWSEAIRNLVDEARRALRRHRRNPSELAWQEYLEACKAKTAAISKAKRKSFEEVIENASKEGGKSFWRLAKWAKSKSSFLHLPPQFLPSPPFKERPQHLRPSVSL